jgi:hypothetical protein
MADQTPNQTGTKSAIDATPGTILAYALVAMLKGSRYALDMDQALALIAAAGIISSYALGFVRGLRKAPAP